jgi:hypothetical protein
LFAQLVGRVFALDQDLSVVVDRGWAQRGPETCHLFIAEPTTSPVSLIALANA